MRLVDYGFAWLLWLSAVAFIFAIEMSHPPGAILDIPFLWLVVAMVNFLRLKNGYDDVIGLKTTCIGANVVGLTMESVRWIHYGSTRVWGPYAMIATVALAAETILSVLRRNDPGTAERG